MKAVIKMWLRVCSKGVLLGAGYLALATLQPAAALTMDATRYVFTGDKDALAVTVSNEAGQTYGGQGWVENIVEQDTRPSFVVTPSFFKVRAGEKQVLRIIKAVELPQDKESVYWLNLQEIPPASEGNGLVVAVRTRVKLFYRPASLIKVRQDAEQNIELVPTETGLVLKNTTPHVFAISGLLDSADKPLEVDSETSLNLTVFKPGDEISVPPTTRKVASVNDIGKVLTYTVGQKNKAEPLPTHTTATMNKK